MKKVQLDRIQNGKGFIAALDQSGGSTPKTLALYGIGADAYSNDKEMFALIHEMRARIITSPAFDQEYILGAILFENTIDAKIEGLYSADYLWEQKGIIPFLKIDKGLAPENNGVRLMLPLEDSLQPILIKAAERNIFGTKMRSVINSANKEGIKEVVEQQFKYAIIIAKAGFMPIIEPEVDINAPDKEEAEQILLEELEKSLNNLDKSIRVMLKLTLPSKDNFYKPLTQNPQAIRVVALSGGYERDEANAILKRNDNIIASFSRALSEGLNIAQTESEFNETLANSIKSIYSASVNKL